MIRNAYGRHDVRSRGNPGMVCHPLHQVWDGAFHRPREERLLGSPMTTAWPCAAPRDAADAKLC